MKYRKLTAVLLALLVVVFCVQMRADADEWSKMSKNLRKAVVSKDGEAIKAALIPIVRCGGEKGVDTVYDVLRAVNPNETTIYWQLVNALATFSDKEAMAHLGDLMVKNKKNYLSRDILFSLQNHRGYGIYVLLEKVIIGAQPDVQKLAIEHVINLDEPNEGTEVLVSALQKVRDKYVKAEIVKALVTITGTNVPGDDEKEWKKWWEVAKSQGGIKRDKSSGEKGGHTGTVVDDLDKVRKDKLYGGEKAGPIEVLVIYGECFGGNKTHHICYDRIDHMTRQMDVKTTAIERKVFENSSYVIDDKFTAVIICCVQIHDHCICPKCRPGTQKTNRMFPCTGCDVHVPCNHKFSEDAVQRLKKWVERGGYLFTEDWGLADVLERAWPGYVSNGTYLPEQMVDVSPAPGSTTHPLLRGVFVSQKKTIKSNKDKGDGGDMTTGIDEETIEERLKPPKNEWKVDDESPNIMVLDKKAVTILMTSKKISDMRQGQGAVALTFGGPRFIPGTGKKGKGLTTGVPTEGMGGARKPGPLGRVLHVLSHFGRQHEREDAFALQNLLLNFLIEGREFKRFRRPRK